jgi:hypothetical protein
MNTFHRRLLFPFGIAILCSFPRVASALQDGTNLQIPVPGSTPPSSTVAASSTLTLNGKTYNAGFLTDGARGDQNAQTYWNDATQHVGGDTVTLSWTSAQVVSEIRLEVPVMETGPYTLSNISVSATSNGSTLSLVTAGTITGGTTEDGCVDLRYVFPSDTPITSVKVTFNGAGNSDGWNFLGEIQVLRMPRTLDDAVSWLHTQAGEMLHDVRRNMTGNYAGQNAYIPANGSYNAFWLRDYEYMLEGRADYFTTTDLLHSANIFLNGLGTGTVALVDGNFDYTGAGVDHVNFDGGPVYWPGTYNTNGDCNANGTMCRMGTWPVTDGDAFTVDIVWQTYMQLGRASRRAFLTNAILQQLKTAMGFIPRDASTGLVSITDVPPGSPPPVQRTNRQPYGFTDSTRKSGLTLFDSLLLVEASRHMADLSRALNADTDADSWDTEAATVTTSIQTHLWDANNGLFFAASVREVQDDIWGSLFAVWLGVATPSQATSIANYVNTNYTGLVKQGQVRHLRHGDYWQDLYDGTTDLTARGTYQDGAFWGTASGWFASVVNTVSPTNATKIALDMVTGYLEWNDANEWLGESNNARGQPENLSSVALPLANLRALQAQRNMTVTSGMTAWLRADAGVTFDAQNRVSAWQDQSSAGNSALQATTAWQPSYVKNAVKGTLPVIRFGGGTPAHLNLATTGQLGMAAHDYEIFLVARTSGDGTQFLTAGGFTDGYEKFELHLNGVAGARFIPSIAATGSTSGGDIFADLGSPGDYSNGAFHVFDARVANGIGILRVDDEESADVVTGAQNPDTARPLTLGVRGDATFPLEGPTAGGAVADILEVLVYDRALSTAERQQVEDYLKMRAALPLH